MTKRTVVLLIASIATLSSALYGQQATANAGIDPLLKDTQEMRRESQAALVKASSPDYLAKLIIAEFIGRNIVPTKERSEHRQFIELSVAEVCVAANQMVKSIPAEAAELARVKKTGLVEEERRLNTDPVVMAIRAIKGQFCGKD